MRVRNVTVALSPDAHHNARLWAAQHDVSLSKVVTALLEGLPTNPNAVRAVRYIHGHRSEFRSQPAKATTNQQTSEMQLDSAQEETKSAEKPQCPLD